MASHSAGKNWRSQRRLQADEARKDSTICDLQGRHANVPEPEFFIPQLQFTSLRMKGEKVNALSVLNQWHLAVCKQSAAFNGCSGKQKIFHFYKSHLVFHEGEATTQLLQTSCSALPACTERSDIVFSPCKLSQKCAKCVLNTLLLHRLRYLAHVGGNLTIPARYLL